MLMLLSSFCGEKKKGSFWHGAPDFQLGILIYSLRRGEKSSVY